MHKDLNGGMREAVEVQAEVLARFLLSEGQSLGIARVAMINAFDKAAMELDANG